MLKRVNEFLEFIKKNYFSNYKELLFPKFENNIKVIFLEAFNMKKDEHLSKLKFLDIVFFESSRFKFENKIGDQSKHYCRNQ